MNEKPTKPPIDYIWPFVGLGLGTGALGLLVLSTDPLVRLLGGLVYGGIPFGLLGLWYAMRRAGRHS